MAIAITLFFTHLGKIMTDTTTPKNPTVDEAIALYEQTIPNADTLDEYGLNDNDILPVIETDTEEDILDDPEA